MVCGHHYCLVRRLSAGELLLGAVHGTWSYGTLHGYVVVLLRQRYLRYVD